ncbi:alpha/beta hydrolase [Streptomyces mauvecolor]
MARGADWLRLSLGPDRVIRRWPSFGAVAGAVLCCCMSMTPSLLPRPWVLHAVIGGISAAIGYAIGALVGAALRRARVRPGPRVMRTAWIALLVVAGLLFVSMPMVSADWERPARRVVGLGTSIDWLTWSLIPVAAIAVCVVIVLAARVVRLATRIVIRLLDRVVPRPAAYITGSILAVLLLVAAVQGLLFNVLLGVAERAASLANTRTSPGITQPNSPLLSGSSASLARWQTLGAQGRDFIGKTTTPTRLTAFSGHPARQPIRVYVGLDTARSLTERAKLAVAELERTGAFDRKVLAVMTSTGSGWVDERAAAPLEYMYAGDSALVALQYSYLPSWISLLTENKAAAAGRALFDAVHERWAEQPAGHRPKLLVFGESLGSYGTELAFPGGLQDLTAHTDGALLAGPPSFNPIWQHLTQARDPGSPVWRPLYRQGRTVRFAQTAPDLRAVPSPDGRPHVVYLQNGSDPIVWWHPRLLVQRPQWLRAPRAADVSPELDWLPLVTFWQLAGDLAVGNSVPAGHGHQYGSMPAAAWAAIAAPDSWTDADTTRLRNLLDHTASTP